MIENGNAARGAAAEQKKSNHRLELDGKKLLSVTGVKNVPSFTDKGMSVGLDGETLLISGKNLEVKNLDVEAGTLTVAGYVTALRYTGAQAAPSGVLKKIFR